jgi:hypothetical protein
VSEATPHADTDERPSRLTPWRLVGIALLAVVLVAVAVVIIVRGTGGKSSPSATTSTTAATVTPIGPVAMSSAALLAFAQGLGRPIYWIGPAPGFTYEFTRTSAGNVFVRYLPKGVQVGDRRPAFTTVGTYPYPGALAALKAVPKAKTVNVAGGGVLVSTASDPRSVHLAYPGVDYQIEVYDPVAGRARVIALSGRVRPIG